MFIPSVRITKMRVNIVVHYARVYKMWAKATQLWNMNFVRASDVASTFDMWFHAFPKGSKILIWRMPFLAIL